MRRRAGGGRTTLSQAVARYLYKLTAYKDEYEVARLMLDQEAAQNIVATFGAGAKISWHVHPTFLRALGVKKKISLGAWFRPVLRMLAAMKGLRGGALDLPGRARVRKIERALPAHYRQLMIAAFDALTPANYDAVAELAAAPDMVRGYEDVKLASVALYKTEIERLAHALGLDPAFGATLDSVAHTPAPQADATKAA